MKKIILYFGTIFILTFIASLIINNNNIKAPSLGSTIAIMVYDENTKEYIKSSEIPKGSYVLNEEKTKCTSGGRVSNYDSVNGTVTYLLDAGDVCNVYFDKITIYTLSDYIKKVAYVSDGINDIYYHDGKGSYDNANLEIGDNSYRYAGTNPDNFVCFEGDDCTKDDNLYRIIGVIDNKVKLIKYSDPSPISYWSWNNNDTWETSTANTYLNSNEKEYTYYTQGDYNDDIGDYDEITMKENGYLYTLGDKANKIDSTIWSVGKNNNSDKIISDFTKNELNYETTYEAKIGLMYVNEYIYASNPAQWSNTIKNFKDSNWMLPLNKSPWTISKSYDEVYFIRETGIIKTIEANPNSLDDDYLYLNGRGNSLYPTFYLKSSIEIKNINSENVGSKSNPMIIN